MSRHSHEAIVKAIMVADVATQAEAEVLAAAGARVVAAERSDFPNRLDNSLVPGLFRGVLDVRAHAITDDVAVAAHVHPRRA